MLEAGLRMLANPHLQRAVRAARFDRSLPDHLRPALGRVLGKLADPALGWRVLVLYALYPWHAAGERALHPAPLLRGAVPRAVWEGALRVGRGEEALYLLTPYWSRIPRGAIDYAALYEEMLRWPDPEVVQRWRLGFEGSEVS